MFVSDISTSAIGFIENKRIVNVREHSKTNILIF